MSWRSEANCVYLVLWLGDRKDRRGFDDGFGFRHLFRHFGARLAQRFELGRIFTANDDGSGVDAMLERVETGGGLALRGTGSGGLLSVEAVSLDLSGSCHDSG
jgi:hypothetical protein